MILSSISLKSILSQSQQQQRSTVSISKPTEISYFSTVKNQDNYSCHSKSRISFNEFRQPQLPCDLNDGFSTFKKTQKLSNSIEQDFLFDSIKKEQPNLTNKTPIDFVTYRNNLNKIMATPYQTRDEWNIDISLFSNYKSKTNMNEKEKKFEEKNLIELNANNNNNNNNDLFSKTIFLHIVEKENNNSFDDNGQNEYFGYRFEKYCTKQTDITPNNNNDRNDSQIDPNVHFCSIVQTMIDGKFNILMGAEIDCFKTMKSSNPTSTSSLSSSTSSSSSSEIYLELKTYKKLVDQRVERNFLKFKTLSFWIQSYLAGVPSILCGFRDEKGIVNEIKEFETHRLPQIASGHWDPQSCLRFTVNILQFLKVNVSKLEAKDFENKTLRMRFLPTTQTIELIWIEKQDQKQSNVNSVEKEENPTKKQKIS